MVKYSLIFLKDSTDNSGYSCARRLLGIHWTNCSRQGLRITESVKPDESWDELRQIVLRIHEAEKNLPQPSKRHWKRCGGTATDWVPRGHLMWAFRLEVAQCTVGLTQERTSTIRALPSSKVGTEKVLGFLFFSLERPVTRTGWVLFDVALGSGGYGPPVNHRL